MYQELNGAMFTPDWHECGRLALPIVPASVDSATVSCTTQTSSTKTTTTRTTTTRTSVTDTNWELNTELQLLDGDNVSVWIPYDFQDSGFHDGCDGGSKYVRSTTYAGIYVGVTICSADRYKIWLSKTICGLFEPIGDGSGSGQDHCVCVIFLLMK